MLCLPTPGQFAASRYGAAFLTLASAPVYVRGMPRVAATVLLLLALVPPADGAPRSTPIALAPDGSAVWVTNPDSNTVARIDPVTHTRLGEFPAGDGPRTVAVTRDAVYVASQRDDAIIRLGLDGSPAGRADLG